MSRNTNREETPRARIPTGGGDGETNVMAAMNIASVPSTAFANNSTQSTVKPNAKADDPTAPSGQPNEKDEDDLDPETQYNKVYDEGDAGKFDALHDLQDVFNELERENLITGYDIFDTYNLSDNNDQKLIRPTSSSRKMNDDLVKKQAQNLTPAPRSGLFPKSKSAQKPTEQTSIQSLPDLLGGRRGSLLDMRQEPTASLPTLYSNKKVDLKKLPQGKKSRWVNQSDFAPQQQKPLPSSRVPLKAIRLTGETPSSSSQTAQSEGPALSPEEKDLADAHQKVREDLDFLQEDDQKDTERESSATELFTRRGGSTSRSSGSASSQIRTPTLPPQSQIPTTTTAAMKRDEMWKSDLVKVTRFKSIPKV
jgi:hypothetical protein